MRSFYSPLSISAPFYGYLKLLSYTERREVETRMRDPGVELRTSCTKAEHKLTVPSLRTSAPFFAAKLSSVPTSVIFEELPHRCHIKKVEIVTKLLKKPEFIF